MRCTRAAGLLVLGACLIGDAAWAGAVRPELWARVVADEIHYGPPAAGNGTFYRGEALLLEVTLSSAVSAWSVEEDWVARLDIELRPGFFVDAARHRPQTLRCLGVERRGAADQVDALFVSPQSPLKALCRLAFPRQDMPTGRYSLRLRWSDAIDRVRFKQPYEDMREFDFELRDVTNAAEELDRDIRRANIAAFEGDVQGALASLTQIIVEHPTSAPALASRANVRVTLGDVAGVQLDRERAAALAERDLDAFQVNTTSREHRRLFASIQRGEATLVCGVGARP